MVRPQDFLASNYHTSLSCPPRFLLPHSNDSTEHRIPMPTTLMDADHHFEDLPRIARRNCVINATSEEDMPRNFLLDVVLTRRPNIAARLSAWAARRASKDKLWPIYILMGWKSYKMGKICGSFLCFLEGTGYEHCFCSVHYNVCSGQK